MFGSRCGSANVDDAVFLQVVRDSDCPGPHLGQPTYRGCPESRGSRFWPSVSGTCESAHVVRQNPAGLLADHSGVIFHAMCIITPFRFRSRLRQSVTSLPNATCAPRCAFGKPLPGPDVPHLDTWLDGLRIANSCLIPSQLWQDFRRKTPNAPFGQLARYPAIA